MNIIWQDSDSVIIQLKNGHSVELFTSDSKIFLKPKDGTNAYFSRYNATPDSAMVEISELPVKADEKGKGIAEVEEVGKASEIASSGERDDGWCESCKQYFFNSHVCR